MRLQHLSATAHPAGNRIVLQWVNLDPAGFPRVRVVRREGTHPTSPVDGIVLTPGDAPPHLEREDGAWISRLEDSGLRSDTVYYYALFPYEEPEPPRAGPDPANRTGAMATAPNGSAARMEELLPAIYRRYDADRVRDNPPGLRPEDRNKGPLRRLLEVTGSQLDQLESFARSTLDLHDIERVDGRLLPLLAQWVGWPTDHRLEIAGQRNELRQAPHIYKTIGIIPTVEATIKRVLGWESRVKEFAHNVFLSNRPERLNLWLRERDAAGVWTTPTEPLSLDFAYEGRPAAGHDAEGTLWLFYHTLRKGEWDIWYKTYRTAEGWSPSQPLTRGSRIDQHPVAVLWEDRLWVFWNSYSETERAWRIESRERSGGEWLSGRVLWDDEIERKRPSAVVDGSGGLWLFWLERVSGRWQLRYNRRVGSGWALPVAASFPQEGGVDPRVEADPFVLFHPTDAAQRLWVFWARKAPAGAPGQTRWEIAYRVKRGLDPSAADWGPVRTLPRSPEDDREPGARMADDGNLEVFWSSTRDRSWSVWRSRLEARSHDWTTPERVTGNPFSERTPLPVALEDGRLLLFYRSNESLAYASSVYGATRTLDSRYAGSTSVDTRNAGKIALRGNFRDFQTYTYDTGDRGRRDERNWYARDTIGIYLTPSVEDPALIPRNRGIIHQVLREFLPIQVRAVLIIEPPPFRELIYTYDFPDVEPQRRIREVFFDSTIPETLPRLRDSYVDSIPDWVWIYSWSEETPDHRTVDFDADPIDTSRRTWHIGVQPGGDR